VRRRTVSARRLVYDAAPLPRKADQLEIFLHFWDEMDDWFGACRHLLQRSFP
jgi:hypothetical protein